MADVHVSGTQTPLGTLQHSQFNLDIGLEEYFVSRSPLLSSPSFPRCEKNWRCPRMSADEVKRLDLEI